MICPTRAARIPPGVEAPGFVLVGVVMFILVQTILGLSLFSLSGFESQFFLASYQNAQAFNDAAGGLERAKWALMATGFLEKAKDGLPRDGVIYAVAKQGDDFATADSMGKVEWNNGVPVWVRVLADHRGKRAYLEARFLPVKADDIYKRLITSYAGITVVDTYAGAAPGDSVRWTQTILTGEVWQNSPDTSWTKVPTLPLGQRPVKLGNAPPPELDPYFAEHWDSATPVTETGVASGPYKLEAGIGNVRFFRTDRVDEFKNPTKIQLSGTAIWLIRDGMRFDHLIDVQGNPGDRLVIVARPGIFPQAPQDPWYGQPAAGIWFNGGLNADEEAVILISDGQVRVVHYNEFPNSSTINYFSIFAGSVFLMGPEHGWPPALLGPRMTLTHPPSTLPDGADPIIDELYDLGVLPNVTAGVRGSFQPLAGTWRQLSTADLN